MAKFCSECGAALAANARFCSGCGASISGHAEHVGASVAGPVEDEPVSVPVSGFVPAPTSAPDLRVAAVPAAGFVDGDEARSGADEDRPKRGGLIMAGAAVVALAVAGGVWMGLSSSGGGETSAEDSAPVTPAVSEEKQSLYAIAKANVRDKASLAGSKIIGSLERGDAVTGTIVTEADGRSWLKVDGAERYVSLANLSKLQPPVLTQLDGSDRIVNGSCVLLEAASANAAVKTSLKKGAAVKNFGKTPDGYSEFGLPGGGVGYAPATSACETIASPAKGAVANNLIQFDPNSCGFGPELEDYFHKGHALRQASSPEQETEEFTIPVDKVFHGLRVTVAIIGYEWHGVAFAEPVNKVKSVFRELGHKMDKDGEFVINEDVPVISNISAIEPGNTPRGKSQLICGV